jgi:hypothetical protein
VSPVSGYYADALDVDKKRLMLASKDSAQLPDTAVHPAACARSWASHAPSAAQETVLECAKEDMPLDSQSIVADTASENLGNACAASLHTPTSYAKVPCAIDCGEPDAPQHSFCSPRSLQLHVLPTKSGMPCSDMQVLHADSAFAAPVPTCMHAPEADAGSAANSLRFSACDECNENIQCLLGEHRPAVSARLTAPDLCLRAGMPPDQATSLLPQEQHTDRLATTRTGEINGEDDMSRVQVRDVLAVVQAHKSPFRAHDEDGLHLQAGLREIGQPAGLLECTVSAVVDGDQQKGQEEHLEPIASSSLQFAQSTVGGAANLAGVRNTTAAEACAITPASQPDAPFAQSSVAEGVQSTIVHAMLAEVIGKIIAADKPSKEVYLQQSPGGGQQEMGMAINASRVDSKTSTCHPAGGAEKHMDSQSGCSAQAALQRGLLQNGKHTGYMCQTTESVLGGATSPDSVADMAPASALSQVQPSSRMDRQSRPSQKNELGNCDATDAELLSLRVRCQRI